MPGSSPVDVHRQINDVVPLLAALQIGADRLPRVALGGVTVEAGDPGHDLAEDPPGGVHEGAWRTRRLLLGHGCGIVGHLLLLVGIPPP